METTRWILAAICLAAFVYAALGNWYCLIQGCIIAIRRREDESAPSWVPLIGGILGCSGVLLCPLEGTNKFWWLPFLMDFGSVPGLLMTLVIFLYWWVTGTWPEKSDVEDT